MCIFLSFLASLLKQCIIFEISLHFSLPSPYTKLKLGKNPGYTRPTLFVGWGEELTWDQALLFVFGFFGSSGKKKNAWYIYLTSSQPPFNLHNLTSAWPVMLLANKRLPYGNQILARIMSLLKSILGKRKFLNTSMFRWRFLKKKLMCCFCDEILLAGAAVPLFNSYK